MAFSTGQRVAHRTFGEGTVLRSRTTGRVTKVSVSFGVRKLRDRTVLALETRHAFETGRETAVFRALGDALGGSVYGLASVFTKACAQPLSLPETDRDLDELLLRDLYVECPRSERAQYIRFERGALLRVATIKGRNRG
jgi:hypothetical protein